MSAQPVDIQIFGRSLRVNCPPDQRDALNQAADDLNQRLQDLKERTRVTNTEQLVFIAALNISYELAQEKAKTRDYAASMEQRIRMLQQTIEQALLEQGRITEKTNQNFSTGATLRWEKRPYDGDREHNLYVEFDMTFRF